MCGEICKICGSSLSKKIDYLDKFNHTLFKNRIIWVCQNCGFGEIWPKIDKDFLSKFYANYYYRSEESVMHIDFKNLNINENLLDFRSLSQLFLAYQYLSNKEKYFFLDIGAGSGFSFVSAKKMFKNVRLFAVEANNDAKMFYIRNFTGISVVDNLNMLKEKMDIILMSHSLEHFDINDIPNLFCDMYNVLSENGIVIIEVPHVDLRNEFVVKARLNDTPHLSFFSLESLKVLVEKSKFELCFINTAGESNDIAFGKNAIMKRRKIYGAHRKISKNVIKSLKKILKFFGVYHSIYNILHKINGSLNRRNDFYDNSNFRYGGNRDLIRCVLRKRL